ncbi:Circadian clock protein KaiC [Myxococcaceae bacterium JPH2]|nr:Circadian clock protein KaiC [Myxococcaceae bacterium JPH2]
MTESPDLPTGPAPRVPTGVDGLDTLLRGGWLRGGTYILTGMPGTGKTLLGNQFCFATVALGGRAVYVTVLTESHSRMVLHLSSLGFFQPEAVGRSLHYVSGSAALKGEGLTGLNRLIFRAVREHDATTLVLDGLSAAEEYAESRLAFREFLHALCVQSALAGCTTLLLTGRPPDGEDSQFALVDGVVALSLDVLGLKAVRGVEVPKFRGGAQLPGRHAFDISDAGVRVFPRAEALYFHPPAEVADPRQRLRFGLPWLDTMLTGGLVRDTSTLLFGAPGTGKTLLGLHFLDEGARREEPGMYLGFQEMPSRLLQAAGGVGLDLRAHVAEGRVHLETQVDVEAPPDALVQRLLAHVEQHRVRRLFLDGLVTFAQESMPPERLPRFLVAVMNMLRERHVTVLIAQETHTLVGPEPSTPQAGLEAVVDNIILLRFVELRARRHRLLSVLKMRESDNDSSLRLYAIGTEGITAHDDASRRRKRPTRPRATGKRGGRA